MDNANQELTFALPSDLDVVYPEKEEDESSGSYSDEGEDKPLVDYIHDSVKEAGMLQDLEKE